MRTQDAFVVDATIDVFERAVRATPAYFPARAPILANLKSSLGVALVIRYQHTHALEDLDRAIEVGEQAMAATPQGHPQQAERLSVLGGALAMRCERTHALEDLDRAIEVGERAVAATPRGDPNRASNLGDLGAALAIRYQRTGTAEDLDRAIEMGEQAVAATPQDDPNRAACLSNLGAARRARYERTGTAEDLDRAIEMGEQAMAATPQGHPNRASYLTNLEAALVIRYQRTGTAEDLDRAIEMGEQAVAATPQDDPNRASYLTNLGNARVIRYQRTGAAEDLDRAIEMGEQAVAATPHGHSDWARHLTNLEATLVIRYQRTGAAEDLDRAIEMGEQAVAATPHGHSDWAAMVVDLGGSLLTRYEHTGSRKDLEGTIGWLREASVTASAPAELRARAAQTWGQLAAQTEDWLQAVDGFGTAVELLGLVGSRALARTDQEFHLTQLSWLGPEATAACLQAGQPLRAVELFEHGRGVLFSQMLDARTDLIDLQAAQPELAAEFVRRRDELDRVDPHPAGMLTDDVDPVNAAQMADRRREAAAQFERTIAEIRTRPGFDRFLAPRPVQELLGAAADGPVVLINVAPLRSDALILTTDGVGVLPLDGVDPEGIVGQVNLFLSALDKIDDPAASVAVRSAAETTLGDVLGWLGDRITNPVLDHLGYTTTPADTEVWPRVWWCPSGPLSVLPMHAAGHHTLSDKHSDAVIDRVISSTIPTVSALLHTRTPPPARRNTRMLVVAMPHTPGQLDLPGAAGEADTLRHLLSGRVDVVGLPGTPPATYDIVTAALPDHPWVHFACHGYSNPADPSTSHLLLADYQTRPLTVVDLTRAHLEGVELAFLSACTTARLGIALPDEPIHLAAACQLAGYRHVVATLWPINDADSAWLTRDFYTVLTATSTPTAANTAASALHHSVRRLRAINRTRPSNWAPYTHAGN